MSTAPPRKPWYAEREFHATVLGVGVGVYLISIGERDLGVALLATSLGSFTISRGVAKHGQTSEPKK